MLDEPKQPYHWGGQGATIAFKRIVKRIISMDDYITPPMQKTKKELYAFNNKSPKKIKKSNVAQKLDIPLNLSIDKGYSKKVKIPELRGLSMRKAMISLNEKGIQFRMNGSGKVAWQSPIPGSFVTRETICEVGLK